MERMASNTKQPEILRELFEALGNDHFVIAECLARPVLAERLLTNWYADDQRVHGELKRRVQADLQLLASLEQMKQSSGTYSEMEFVRSDTARLAGNGITLNSGEWDKAVRQVAALFHRAAELNETIPVGMLSPLHEDAMGYYVTAVVERSEDRLKLATVQWLKEPLESWLTRAEIQVPHAIALPNPNYRLPEI